MTLKELASKLALKEGKKIQISIGNVRELIGLLSDLAYEDSSFLALLIANGAKRSKRKKK